MSWHRSSALAVHVGYLYVNIAVFISQAYVIIVDFDI